MATFYGSGVGGDNPERMVIKTIATINSQNTVLNKSNVTIKVYAYYNYSQYTPPNPTEGAQYIKVDNVTKVDSSKNTDFTGTSASNPLFLMQWTGDIEHNVDGKKTINLKVYQNTPNVRTMNYLYGDHNWTLPTIPRNSKITSFPNFTIGNGVTVKAPRDSTTFTNTFDIYVGQTFIASSGAIKADTYTFTASQLDGIYARIPNTTTATVTAYVGTRSGTTLIGTIDNRTATASVGSNIKPEFSSLTSVETSSAVSALILGADNYAQTISMPKFTINGATANKSARITAYEIKFEGTVSTKSSVVFKNLNLVGTKKAYARVKDSRGIWSDTRSVTVVFHEYSFPKITRLTGFRTKTSTTTTLDVLGEYHRTGYGGSISSLNSKNKLNYALYYRKVGDTSFTQIEKITTPTNSFNYTKNFGDGATYFKVINSYELKLNVTDSIGNLASSTMLISTGNVPMSFGKDGIGAGKVWERGALDIAGDVYLDGDKLVEYGTHANGHWVRYADGTQICYGTVQFTMPNIVQLGSVYGFSSSDYKTLYYPKEFISKPTVEIKTEIGEELNCALRTVGTTNCTWRLYMYLNAFSGEVKNMSFKLTGRWK